MEFCILNAANIEEYETWIRIWTTWPLREVFAHPEYVKLFARECDQVICAVQESAGGFILLPMVLRPLASETWAGDDNEKYDIVSPYGYGGPYVTGRYDLKNFWRRLNDWAAGANVISAFFRLSPYAADIGEFVDTVDTAGGNVIRSLSCGREGIWNDYKHAVRTCVRGAEQSGVTVVFDEAGDGLPDFISMYYRTMQRRNASQQYYFPEEFFQHIKSQLPGQFFLAFAKYQGAMIAGKLVLISQEHIYPFLGGADEAFFKLNPTQLLDTNIFYWGVDHGKKSCVLGGGYNGYDGVFQYKKKFAPSGVVPFLVGKHIFNPDAYQTMCTKRKCHELECGKFWKDETAYFPVYRAEAVEAVSCTVSDRGEAG